MRVVSALWVKVHILGYGLCSVNIMKLLYNKDYYGAKITTHDVEICFRQSTEGGLLQF